MNCGCNHLISLTGMLKFLIDTNRRNLMCDRYIAKDANVMRGVFDEFFFRTGDLARREGSNCFILGRASQDCM